jgi:hypothetical protein
VNELRTQFNDFSLFAQGPDAAANVIPSLQYQYLAPCLGQRSRCGQPCHSCADHQNAFASCFHDLWMRARRFRTPICHAHPVSTVVLTLF